MRDLHTGMRGWHTVRVRGDPVRTMRTSDGLARQAARLNQQAYLRWSEVGGQFGHLDVQRVGALKPGFSLTHSRLDIFEHVSKWKPECARQPDESEEAGVANASLDVGDVVPRQLRRLGKVFLTQPPLFARAAQRPPEGRQQLGLGGLHSAGVSHYRWHFDINDGRQNTAIR